MGHPSRWADPTANAWRADAADADFRAAREAVAPIRVAQARALAVLDVSHHFRFEGCATLEEYAERQGVAAGETRMLAQVGHAFERVRGLEEALLEGRLSFESARALWSIVRPRDDDDPAARLPVAKLLRLACRTSTRDFRRLARWYLATKRLGAEPEILTFYVSPGTRDKLRHATAVARHREKRRLTQDELFEILVDEWLERNDPGRKGTRGRIVDDVDRDGRKISLATKAIVWERDGGRCIHPGCTWEGELHLGHITPAAEGGGNHEDELCLQCPVHNHLEHRGYVKLVGPAEDPGFVYLFHGDDPDVKPTRKMWRQAEHRKRLTEIARRRWYGEAGEPRAKTDAELFDALIDRLEQLESRRRRDCAGRFRLDDRLRVPYLESRDPKKLSRWIDEMIRDPT